MRTGRARVLAAAALVSVAALAACGAPADVPAASPSAAAPSSSRDARAAQPIAPAACEDAALARLDPRRRAAQLVMSGVPADGLTGEAREAMAESPGGVILTDATGGEDVSRTQVERTVRAVQATATDDVPLLVSTDQEGGRVQDLAGEGFATVPPAVAQGRDVTGLRAEATGWARQLAAAGVTMNLAPVADVVDPGLGTANAPVGKLGRGFGTDAEQVGSAVTAFVGGMVAGGVAPTLKHFPGLGKVRENTDFAGAEDSVTARGDADLASFADGIRAGAPVVMMSSARYERIDPDQPALFSRAVVTDLLRGDLGFDGVVMTDDVGAAEAVADVSPGQRAVRFVEAGGDLVLTIRPADVTPMVDAMTARAASDPDFAARVDQSARRVLALKAGRGVLRC